MLTPEIPKAANDDEFADFRAWIRLMNGDLNALLEFIREGRSIHPNSYVAEFLELALSGQGEFKVQLSLKGRGRRSTLQQWEAMDRRVRIGWFIEARLRRGLAFDAVIADAVNEFGIGRKSAEADLTYFRRCWSQTCSPDGCDPGYITDPDLKAFADSWIDIWEAYPNG